MGIPLKTMGFSGDQHTPHGFRATARTVLDEVLGFRPIGSSISSRILCEM